MADDEITAREAKEADITPISVAQVTKRRGVSLFLHEGRMEATRIYEFVDANGKTAYPWQVDVRNGECLGNGGNIDGIAITIKDGYNRVVELLDSPKGDVLAALDALLDEAGLLPK